QIDEKPVPQNAFQNTSATQPTPVGDAFAEQCPAQGDYPATASDGQPFIYGCIWTPYDDKQFIATAPGAGGGTNWSPSSYNPNTGFLYTCSGNTRQAEKAIPNASSLYVGGRGFTGRQSSGLAPTFRGTGDFTAMNTPAWTALVGGKQYLFVYADGRNTTANPATKGDSLYAYFLG